MKHTFKLSVFLYLSFSLGLSWAVELSDEERIQGITHLADFKKIDVIRKVRLLRDYSPLIEAAAAKDLPLLWYAVVAYIPKYNVPMEVTQIHLDYQKKAKSLLSHIPGHTQLHIDILEEKAKLSLELALRADGTPNWYPPRGHNIKTMEEHQEWERKERRSVVETDREFNQLEELGSPECVQTLMTYLEDDRRVGFTADMDGKHYAAAPNSYKAILALQGILGDDRPDKDLDEKRDPYQPRNPEATRASYREWWQSEKSLPWRKTIYPTSRSKLLPGATSPTSSAGHGRAYWLWLCALIVLGLLSLWLAVKRYNISK
jgi:hypothetical protein